MLAAADAEWVRPVVEPPGPNVDRIDSFIRGGQGLDWPTAKVGVPSVAYTRNGQFAWCLAFMAHCWGAAGLRRALRYHVCSSTYRLWALGTGVPSVVKKVGRSEGFLFQELRHGRDPEWEPGPGDVLIVGPRRDLAKPWSCHGTLVREVDWGRGEILTVEGNAKGVQPDGEVREGVVHQRRPLPRSGLPARRYRARFVLRWGWGDLVGVEG